MVPSGASRSGSVTQISREPSREETGVVNSEIEDQRQVVDESKARIERLKSEFGVEVGSWKY